MLFYRWKIEQKPRKHKLFWRGSEWEKYEKTKDNYALLYGVYCHCFFQAKYSQIYESIMQQTIYTHTGSITAAFLYIEHHFYSTRNCHVQDPWLKLQQK